MLAKELYNGIILELLHKDSKAKYMEIGSFDGEGIALLCNTFPERVFYSIDPFIEDGNTTQVKKGELLTKIRGDFFRNTNECKNLMYFDMTSAEFLDKKLFKLFSINILFIDGDHSFETTSVDLSIAALFALKNSVYVIVDDIHISDVRKALRIFRQKYDIELKVIEEEQSIYFYLPLQKV